MTTRTGRMAGMLALVGLMLLAACAPNGGNSTQETTTILSPLSATTPASTTVPTTAPSSSATGSVPVTGQATASPIAMTAAPGATQAVATATPIATQVPSTAAPTNPPVSPTVTTVTQFPNVGSAHWTTIVSGLIEPVDLKDPGDGSGRLFVLEQPGRIRIIQNGQLLNTPFLDITDRVGSRGTEQGLLGLAFDPNYKQNGIFFINYTNNQGDSVVSQWRVSSSNPNQADSQSEQILLTVDQPFQNHNGGGVQFGPDGYLYLSFGDGGSEGDPQLNGQNTQNMLADILRIQPNLNGGYRVPPDNPFANGQGGKPEVFIYGLRNPWRFSFDKATGDMYIADVGQNNWEEINFLSAGSSGGENFGWSYYEGNHPYKGTPPQSQKFTFPVYEYSHNYGCAVSGGYVYRGQSMPDWQGVYLFGDYCSGIVWGLLRDAQGQWQAQQLFQTSFRISAFGQDSSGEVYLLDHGKGQVLKLEP